MCIPSNNTSVSTFALSTGGNTRLQFPPQSTLEAVHTVHDPGDVEEGQSDILLAETQVLHY